MKSIALRLWAGMMALIVVILGFLWFFQIVFLESFYTNKSISDVKKQGTFLMQLYNKDGNISDFENKLESFAYENNLSIEVLDLNGNSIYVTGPTGLSGHIPMIKSSARIESFQKVLAGKEVATPLTHPRFGNKFMLIGLPIKTTGKLTGVLLINMPLAPVEKTAAILKSQLFYVTIILFAVSALISFLLSRNFIKPILEIEKVSETMASGDFSARIKSKRQDEIGKLAQTINFLGQQLSKTEQFRKDLFANVSHELRTPLSLIRGYAETIRDVTGDNPEKRDQHIAIIIEEADRLSEIVADILNFSQLQAGYFTINKTRFPIKQLVDAVVRRFEDMSQKKGVQIVHQGSGEALVEADEARIGQVLINLVNNALRHTPGGGTIKVNIEDNPMSVRVEVSDTGKGIKEEDIPYIWDRYFTAGTDGAKDSLGTGLGLAIVKIILDAHQVQYGVKSTKDIGTTFWLELNK